jgi:DNA-binding MarR family transcriptional regulator
LDFVAFSTRWRAGLPTSLGREPPSTLLQLLAIVEIADGISQADLQRKIGMNQSRLSKLITKLIAARLVSETYDYHDRRLQLLKLTVRGSDRLRFLDPKLTGAAIKILADGKIELIP